MRKASVWVKWLWAAAGAALVLAGTVATVGGGREAAKPALVLPASEPPVFPPGG